MARGLPREERECAMSAWTTLRGIISLILGVPPKHDSIPESIKAPPKAKTEQERRVMVEEAVTVREEMREKTDKATGAPPKIEPVVVEPPSAADFFKLKCWSVPKPGNAPEQNQDAWAAEEVNGSLRLTLSDGLTDGSFDSRGWARALCRHFLARPKGAIQSTWLNERKDEIATTFAGSVKERVEKTDTTKSFAWMAPHRAAKGSKATLLGLELGATRANGAAYWKAFAAGDSNLFLVRDGKLIRAWPIDDPKEFGVQPETVETNADRETEWQTDGKGWAKQGDRFYLMSDALAEYALRRERANKPIWGVLSRLRSPGGFAKFVELAREDGMTKDDTTLQRFVVPGPTEGREREERMLGDSDGV